MPFFLIKSFSKSDVLEENDGLLPFPNNSSYVCILICTISNPFPLIQLIEFKMSSLFSIATSGDGEEFAVFFDLLKTQGMNVLKFGRKGNPHMKSVFITGDLKYLKWNGALVSSKRGRLCYGKV